MSVTGYYICCLGSPTCWGHPVVTPPDLAQPMMERCGCDGEWTLGHVKVSKWAFRYLTSFDVEGAYKLGTCPGSKFGRLRKLPFAVELDMLWDRLDLVLEAYPYSQLYAVRMVDTWSVTNSTPLERLMEWSPRRHRILFEGRVNMDNVDLTSEESSSSDGSAASATTSDPGLAPAPVLPMILETDEVLSDDDSNDSVSFLFARGPRTPKREKLVRIAPRPPPDAPPRPVSDRVNRRLSLGAGAGAGAGDGEKAKSKRKRLSEIEHLRERCGFKTDLRPSSSRRIGSRACPLKVYEDSDEWDSESELDSLESMWILSLVESVEYEKDVKRRMDTAMTLAEHCAAWKELQSLREHIRDLKAARTSATQKRRDSF